MDDKRYTISDAATMTELETHVLRYWEDELDIHIPRNEMGHRFYTQEHIDTFRKIKSYRDMGYQLKTIRLLIDKDGEVSESVLTVSKPKMPEKPDKLQQFENIIGQVVERVLRENNAFLSDEIGYKVSDKVVKEMDYHMRVREEIEEERFKKLDETIRSFQKSKKEKKKLKLRK
ncbi:MAG: MerR family transcriptional regulator [Lachnospiraceae bacterium]|nr:MerR family transcriptional regulator [Lachnospira sp.]MBR6696662.1 MerR family transcriptional regulator [Lachnospiraceae bacterium]